MVDLNVVALWIGYGFMLFSAAVTAIYMILLFLLFLLFKFDDSKSKRNG